MSSRSASPIEDVTRRSPALWDASTAGRKPQRAYDGWVDRTAALIATLVIAALVVVVAVGAGLVGGTTTTSEVVDVEQPDTTSEGVVYLERDEPRSRLLGFEFGHRYSLGVSFLVDADCIEQLDDDGSWPVDHPSCASSVEVAGDIELTGRDSDGRGLVGVVFDVSRECFEAAEAGDRWSDVAAICSAD